MTALVHISEDALRAIEALAAESASQHLETGGFLIGTRDRENIKILHAIGPGPNAKRTASIFEPDYGFTGRELARLKCVTPNNLVILGGWHLHSLAGLSHGDKDTLLRTNKGWPGFIALVVCGRERKVRLFGVENEKSVEVPWAVLEPEKAATDFDRIEALVPLGVLARRKVVQFGLGSASLIPLYLVRAGVLNFVLVDDDKLEKPNLVRHVGHYFQVGMPKTEVVATELRLTNPDVKVRTFQTKLTRETKDDFARHIRKSHLVLACSGSAEANHLLNEICIEERKPVIFGGIFARGSGGFVLSSRPYDRCSPCLNCIFEHVRHARDDSNAALHHMARDYGMTEQELSAQQGLYIDISFVALLQAKMALHALLRGSKHNLPKLPGNLVVWNSETMSARWATVRKRDDCAVCNSEQWLKSRFQKLGDVAPVEQPVQG